MQHLLKTKAFRIAAIAVLLIGLYALAGFVLAPKLLRNALLEDIPKLMKLTPTIGEVRINPFSLHLEIKDFSLADAGGEKLVGFERFFVEFELSSLWHRAYTLGTIDLTAPFVNAIIAKDGRLNLLQLSPQSPPPRSPAPAPKKAEPMPAVRIGQFAVSRGWLSFDDRSRPSDFAARIEPINFELHDFTTGSEGGRFTFSGASKRGERIEWRGHVSVQPIESDGDIQIDGLLANTIWAYLKDQLNFLVNSGKIDLNATYKFALKDTVDLQVNVSKVALSDLAVRPRDSDTDWIAVPELDVGNASLDLSKREAHVDSLSIAGLKVIAWLEPDGSLNLLKLAAPPAPAQAAASPAAPASAPPAVAATPAARPSRPWQFDLREFALRDANLSMEDRGTQPAVRVLLAPFSLKVDGASLDLAKPVKVSLDTKINDKGSLTAAGTVVPQPASADLSLKLADIQLSAIQPYIGRYTSMTLLTGALGGDAKVHFGPQKPVLQFAGNISVDHLHTVDNALHADFVNWERLDVQGIKFQHDPDRLDIEQVAAHKAYARVIVEPDDSINVKRVLAGPGATVTAPNGSGAPVTATAPPAPVKAARNSRKAAPVPAAAAPAAAPAAVMPMSIKKIALLAGRADFADLSVTPNFATGIQNLEGTVLGLSSKPASRAKVDIKGSVDQFAPVSISGEVNVLSAALYTDLALSFRNIELSTFNPYSGKFAGYNISKGKLTTELHYKVDGRKLDAQHHIIVDQLEFGEKTASKDAVSLPVKLAVALLKDKDGVIDLSLPVTGSLDDPKFRLGPIIWKVFINILEKAVTAPFALLGSLFGGGPDLQFVDFQPGSSDLEPAAVDKAQSVAKALTARPQLKIEIPIAVVKEIDSPHLADLKLQAQIQEVLGASPARKKTAPGTPDFAQMDPAAQLDILTRVYARNVGAEPKFPDTVASLKSKPEIVAAKVDYLNGALRERITISESDLTALGEKRAMNLQDALLTGTPIDPARVFLVANDKAKNQNGAVRLELSLR
ncbi:MAG TPA: DUF748 domain-containing protein [Steroidobacteraceae bacterium]